MSVQEQLSTFHGEGCAELKLKALRRMLVGPTATVQNVAVLLRQIDAEIVQGLPPDIPPAEFERMLRWLSEAGDDLEQILNTLSVEVGEPAAHAP
jgi:hypothetical protein